MRSNFTKSFRSRRLVLLQDGGQGPHAACIACGLRLSGVFIESVAHGLQIRRIFAAGARLFDFRDRGFQRSKARGGKGSATLELSDVGLTDDQILWPYDLWLTLHVEGVEMHLIRGVDLF